MQSKLFRNITFTSLVLVIALLMAGQVRLILTNILWGITAVSGIIWAVQSKVHKKPAVFLLHISFLIILAGALTTHLWGIQGAVHMREGETAERFISRDGTQHVLPFSIKLESFEAIPYPDTYIPKDFISHVEANEKKADISMNNILKVGGYRFYQSGYDHDGMGSTLAVNHDPWGIGITYTGYGLLFLSLFLFFFADGTRFKTVLHRARGGNGSNGGRISLVLGIFMGIVALALTVILGIRWYKGGHVPMASGYELMLFIAWLASCLAAIPWKHAGVLRPAGMLVTGFALVAAMMSGKGQEAGPLVPVLSSPLLPIHVGCMIISYTLLAIAAVTGLIGIVRKKSSQKMADNALLMVYPGLFLLTAGTFIGAIWANVSWGNYWSWDPKETWALVTMLVYSFGIHSGSCNFLRKPAVFNWFCVIAFICVLFTYFGVNYFLGGMHSYA